MGRPAAPYASRITSGVSHLEPPYIPGFAVATFVWSTEHGHCYECGLPAAFYLPYAYVREPMTDGAESPTNANKRCAVCAANAAADGDAVRRIAQED